MEERRRGEFGLRSDGRGGWSALAAGGVGKDSFTYIGAVAHCRDKASVGDVKCCQKQRTPSRDTNGNQKWSWRKTRGDAAQKGDELFSLSRRPFSNFQGKSSRYETGLAHFEPGDFELLRFFDLDQCFVTLLKILRLKFLYESNFFEDQFFEDQIISLQFDKWNINDINKFYITWIFEELIYKNFACLLLHLT